MSVDMPLSRFILLLQIYTINKCYILMSKLKLNKFFIEL